MQNICLCNCLLSSDIYNVTDFQGSDGKVVKNPPANAGDTGHGFDPLVEEDPLKQETATHSGILAWKIPWTEEPGALQSMGQQRIGHDCTLEHTQQIFNSSNFKFSQTHNSSAYPTYN